jgi:arginyl-tRNA synthetase
MNTAIQNALAQAVTALQSQNIIPQDWQNNSVLTRTKDRSHGDFASNIAMVASKVAGMKPRDLAQIYQLLLTSVRRKSQDLVLSISF